MVFHLLCQNFIPMLGLVREFVSKPSQRCSNINNIAIEKFPLIEISSETLNYCSNKD